MPYFSPNFGRLEGPPHDYETASSVILPVPFERSTTYGQGTRNGPEAILRASYNLELYDEELDGEPADAGLCTLPVYMPEPFAMDQAFDDLEAETQRHFAAGKFLITLGGEHSLSLGPIRGARAAIGDFGVVQFDAHTDLRAAYEDTPYSHASIMRRVFDLGLPAVALGIRSVSTEEVLFLREKKLPIVWAHELGSAEERFDGLLDALPERIYLTFDLDFFDPSLVPATGTPEPGGGSWYPALRLLRRLFETKNVIGMDIVELAPIPGQPASDFLAAKLLYKCHGYRHRAKIRPPRP